MEIRFNEYQERIQKGETIILIDVREKVEFQIYNIGGVNLPLSTLPDHVSQVPKDGTVVVTCQAGIRSQKAINYLKANYGYENLLNLIGGLNAVPQ